MIVTITNVSQEFTKTGAEYRKITGTTPDGKEVTKTIFDNLKFLWHLLEEGKSVEFKMVQKGQFWNVINIKNADEPWPEDTSAVANDEVVKKPTEPKPDPPPKPKERNPQEVGLAYKILSELYVNGFIDENKADGKELVLRLKMWLKEVLLAH